MIFKYIITTINSLNYISGSRLISEKGTPSGNYEFTKPFGSMGDLRVRNLTDENGKLQWTIRDNPDYDPETDHIDDRYLIEHKPILLTADEKETKRAAEAKAKLAAELVDLIYANKDNPDALAQALCERAKEIDAATIAEATK